MTTDRELSEAIVAWTGWGRVPFPTRSEERVVDIVGPERTVDVIEAVRRMEADFFRSEARLVVADLAEMGRRAADEFRTRHPEVSDDAVDALRWCYMYAYK